MEPTASLSIIWVHYHTPEVLLESVECVRRELATHGIAGELVVVDNGSRSGDRERFRDAPLRWVGTGTNLGYAGAVNRGVAETRSDHILILNPDVLLLPGSMTALQGALERFCVVAPSLFLDRNRVLRLPPTERRDFLSRLLDVLIGLGPFWTGVARRRWRRHAYRFWNGEGPVLGHDLSGAALAFRRESWQRIGPWDDGYPLYFEETDWLFRARRAGVSAAFIPAAEGVHLYAQSSQHEAKCAEWFQISQTRFESRHYPLWQRRLLGRISHVVQNRQRELPTIPFGKIPTESCSLELSPLPRGYPAASGPVQAQDWEPVVNSVHRQLQAGQYFLRWIDCKGREVALRILNIDQS